MFFCNVDSNHSRSIFWITGRIKSFTKRLQIASTTKESYILSKIMVHCSGAVLDEIRVEWNWNGDRVVTYFNWSGFHL